MIPISLYLASLTCVISFFCVRLVIGAGVADIPVNRSNHTQPTPTAGGLGVLGGLSAGLLALSFLGQGGMFSELSVLLSLSFAIALVGLYDDLFSPPTLIKFGIFIGIILLLIDFLGPVQQFPIGQHILQLSFWLGVLGTLLWVFVVVNGVNFMDGANGLMVGSMVIAFIGLSLMGYILGAPQTFWLGLICASAWAGFLPMNLQRKALIFSGDVGALSAGFLFAGGVLLLAYEVEFAASICLGALLILPFLTDVLLTLLWRLTRRQNLLMPHRDHLYQRAIRCGVSHVKISLIYYSAFLLCTVIALFITSQDHEVISNVLFMMIIISILTYIVGHKVWRVARD
ncbi:MAG: hypothetical protein ABJ275_03670 [Maricaulaceae bacterium]